MWAVAAYLWYLGSNYLRGVITSPIVSAVSPVHHVLTIMSTPVSTITSSIHHVLD